MSRWLFVFATLAACAPAAPGSVTVSAPPTASVPPPPPHVAAETKPCHATCFDDIAVQAVREHADAKERDLASLRGRERRVRRLRREDWRDRLRDVRRRHAARSGDAGRDPPDDETPSRRARRRIVHDAYRDAELAYFLRVNGGSRAAILTALARAHALDVRAVVSP